MKFREGCEYVTIRKGTTVVMDGELIDWVPEDAKNKHGAILAGMRDKYLEVVFNIVTKKPYPERRRMMLTGIFFDGSIYQGYRQIEAWKEDLIFFICKNGKLKKTTKPKPKKIKVIKESPLVTLENDILEDIENLEADKTRDLSFEY